MDVQEERRVEAFVVLREEPRPVDDLVIAVRRPIMNSMNVSAGRDMKREMLQPHSMTRVVAVLKGWVQEDLGAVPVTRPVPGIPFPDEANERHELVVVRPCSLDIWHTQTDVIDRHRWAPYAVQGRGVAALAGSTCDLVGTGRYISHRRLGYCHLPMCDDTLSARPGRREAEVPCAFSCAAPQRPLSNCSVDGVRKRFDDDSASSLSAPALRC